MDATEVSPTPPEAESDPSLKSALDTLLENRTFQLIVFFASAVVCAIVALLDTHIAFRVFFFLCAAVSTASFVVVLTDDGDDSDVTVF